MNFIIALMPQNILGRSRQEKEALMQSISTVAVETHFQTAHTHTPLNTDNPSPDNLRHMQRWNSSLTSFSPASICNAKLTSL